MPDVPSPADRPAIPPAGPTGPTGPDALPRVAAVLADGVRGGLHLGAQCYASLDGRPVADFAVGEARPGVAMAAGSLTLWLSAGKPATAVAVGLLVDAGALSVDAPVAEYVPEFAANGKAGVTVAHVLTHTGGFRPAAANTSAKSWGEIMAGIYAAPLEPGWTPGATAGYHVASGWFVLGEVVRRADARLTGGPGRDPCAFARQEVFEPLGMADSWVGVPPDRLAAYGGRVAVTYDTSQAVDEGGAKPLAFFNSDAGLTSCRPGGNARGPVRELGRMYESLLRSRGDLDAGGSNLKAEISDSRSPAPPPALLSRDTALAFTGRRRSGLTDKTFGRAIDWGYGFLLNTPATSADPAGRPAHPYGYGPHASAETFGHSGNQSSCAFADPARRLVVAWATNGLPGELKHQRRQVAVNAAVYEDLGLVG